MFEEKLIVVKCITLLYCEYIRNSKKHLDSKHLVLNLVKGIKPVKDEDSLDRNILESLKSTLLEIVEDHNYDLLNPVALTQRLLVCASADSQLLDIYKLPNELDTLSKEELNEVIKSIKGELYSINNERHVRRLINETYKKFNYGDPNLKGVYLDELKEGLADHFTVGAGDLTRFIISAININDVDEVEKLLSKAVDAASGKTGFTTGYKELNAAFGESGKLRLGWFGVILGLTHEYKSGLLHDLFTHLCLYNTPTVREGRGKPTLFLISAENTAEYDIERMYRVLKEPELKERVKISSIDKKEASEYIKERLTKTGFEVIMMRIDGVICTYQDFSDIMQDYINQGYDPQAVCLDYASLMNKSGLTSSSMTGEDTRILFHRLRLWANINECLFLTPHQLSQEAMREKAKSLDLNTWLSTIVGKNLIDGSKRIINEVDFEIYVNRVKYYGKSYLNVAVGKLRLQDKPDDKLMNFYLPFSPYGFILDTYMTDHEPIYKLKPNVDYDNEEELEFF